MTERLYLTPVEAAELLMVSTASVRLWASKGLLPAQTTAGGHRRFLRRDIEQFAQQRGIALPAQKTTPAKADGDLRVLIADDDQQLVRYLRELLNDQPGVAAIEAAGDGFEAGQKLETFKPDVLMLDLMMPGIDGFEVCKRLKQNVATRDIRVVAMTGHNTQEAVERILASGAEVCLSKPLQTDRVLKILGVTA